MCRIAAQPCLVVIIGTTSRAAGHDPSPDLYGYATKAAANSTNHAKPTGKTTQPKRYGQWQLDLTNLTPLQAVVAQHRKKAAKQFGGQTPLGSVWATG